MVPYIPDGQITSKNEWKIITAARGAKYTKSRRPVELIYYEEFETKEDAMRREWQIKQLTRKKKEELIKACHQ